MKLGLGLGLSSRRYGGAAAYHADAVHFDGASTLSIASLTSTDGGDFLCSLWAKMSLAAFNGSAFWVVDPENDYLSALQPAFGAAKFSFSLISSGFVTLSASNGAVVSTDTWLNVLIAAKTNLTAGNKVLQIYVNDAAYSFTTGDIGDSFNAAFNGLPFFVGGDTSAFIDGDLSEVWVAPGQYLDISVQANRRKFISAAGKPVDLGADGSTPTGAAPAIFFSGDATGFATNRGTGGAFTLTGSLTNASTSPSD